MKFLVPSRDVLRMRGESLQRAPTEIIRVLHKRLLHVRGGYHVPSDVGLETWEYR